MELRNGNSDQNKPREPLFLIKDLYAFIATPGGKDNLRNYMATSSLTLCEAQYIWEYLLTLQHFQDVDLLNDLCEYIDDIYKMENTN